MDEIEMLLKSSTFYIKEAERLGKKLRKLKSKPAKVKCLKEMEALRTKIVFEIKQISNILDREDGSY
ncbi:MAG: hypothetical protein EB127_31555 [Alphaproteobacteria bacterium]|jgi:hypothetical protein|nr:hypothetical protein [Alphaproteobacteria bacterium]